MITHSSFRVEIDDIISDIKTISSDNYLEKYVNIPEISVIRLQLLNLFLYHASVPKPLRRLFCVTTGLIQIGLDLHETITNHKESGERRIRNRQLSILAGDYYSSHYYFLLSKDNLTEGIKRLAIAIRNINIAKMNLYTQNNHQGFNSIDQLSDLIKIRESNLYIQFMDQMQSDKQRTYWKVIIEEMSLLFSLLEEIQTKHLKQHHFSNYLVNYYSNTVEKNDISETLLSGDVNIKVNNLYHKYNVKRKIEDLIFNLNDNLNKKISEIEDKIIQGELFYILGKFTNSYNLFNALEKI